MSFLQQIANNAASIAVEQWIAPRRAELVEAIRTAQADRGRDILLQICEAHPAAAGIITLLMNGTADTAIRNVAIFDPDLALELNAHLETFAQVQTLMKENSRLVQSQK